jgi:hypothetical protein
MKAKELIGYSEPSQPFEKLFKLFQSLLKKNEKAPLWRKRPACAFYLIFQLSLQ